MSTQNETQPTTAEQKLYGTMRELRDYERYEAAHPKDFKSGLAPEKDKVVAKGLAILEAERGETGRTRRRQFDVKMDELKQEVSAQHGGDVVDQKGTTKEESLRQESCECLREYGHKAGKLKREIEVLGQTVRSLEEEARTDPNFDPLNRGDDLEDLEQLIAKRQTALNEELPFANPESFLAHQLLRLRDFKRQLRETDVVATESVARLDETITLKLMERRRTVALVGETGTGKTKTAKKIATRFYEKFHPGQKTDESYEFVMGHKFTTKEDLLSYMGLSATSQSAEDTLKLIAQAQEKFAQSLGPDVAPEKKAEALEDIKKIIIGQSESPQLRTERFLAPVLKARKTGKIVIIDEFNYIEPGLLASLNELMEPEGATEGFGIIFTGNLTLADAKRYTERRTLDPAFINRLNSSLIEYNTPPQDDVDRYLDIGLFMSSKKCVNNFAGKPIRDTDRFFDAELRLHLTHASMRTLIEVLETWKADAFRYPIEYYLYEQLIRPSSVIAPTESAYFYKILKDKFSFFRDPYWEQKIKIDDVTKRIQLDPTVKKQDLKSTVPQKLFTAFEVAEAFSGNVGPKEKGQSEAQKKETGRQALQAEVVKMEEQVRQIKSFLRDFGGDPEDPICKTQPDNLICQGGTLARFCEDEARIMQPTA